jgi:hypothetical protein
MIIEGMTYEEAKFWWDLMWGSLFAFFGAWLAIEVWKVLDDRKRAKTNPPR